MNTSRKNSSEALKLGSENKENTIRIFFKITIVENEAVKTSKSYDLFLGFVELMVAEIN